NINLFTSKWSPINSVPSMEADGILKACTMKLVPKSARITVTNSDSRYSEIVVWSAWCSCFVSGACSWISATVSSGIPRQPFACARLSWSKALRAARCSASFSCCPRLSPYTPRLSKLRSERLSGGLGRFLQPCDIPQVHAPVPARVPATRIFDRTPRYARRALQAPAQTGPFARPRGRHPVRHPGKPQPPLLQTRRPEVSVSRDLRFSLHRVPAASVHRGAGDAQPSPATLPSRYA